jgi:hypothetical protein
MGVVGGCAADKQVVATVACQVVGFQAADQDVAAGWL